MIAHLKVFTVAWITNVKQVQKNAEHQKVRMWIRYFPSLLSKSLFRCMKRCFMQAFYSLSDFNINWYLVAKNRSCTGRQIDMGLQLTLKKCAEACHPCENCEQLSMFTFEGNGRKCKNDGCQCFCQYESDKDGCTDWHNVTKNFDLYKYLLEGNNYCNSFWKCHFENKYTI